MRGKDQEFRSSGRDRFLRYLLDFPRTYGEIMMSRHRAYSCYLQSFAALFLGYHKMHILDDLRFGHDISFNLHGEAIVLTPNDAIRTFFSSGMGALVIGSFLVEK